MFPKLQTSPYLTCILPNEPIPIVYMTDTKEPTCPEQDKAENAAFGVIGLDRKTVWHTEIRALKALEFAAKRPIAEHELIQMFGAGLISDLKHRGWLQYPEDLCKEYWLRTGQIEITSHCNWRCNYCPVSQDPKPKATMSLSLFEEIVEKLSKVPTIKFITFHFYNEATLDKFFKDRIYILAKYGMKLSLASNGSALTEDKICLLKDTGVLHHLLINMPTLDGEKFREFTGSSSSYKFSIKNVDLAISMGLPITIAVNGTQEELSANLPALKEKYEPLGAEVRPFLTCDRAGSLKGKYNQGVAVKGRLRGCSWPLNHAHFSINGDMFICCNDYYQREIFGNIKDGSIAEIMESPAAIVLRRKVFGVDMAEEDFVCRSCHDQRLDFKHRQFRPPASFPILKD